MTAATTATYNLFISRVLSEDAAEHVATEFIPASVASSGALVMERLLAWLETQPGMMSGDVRMDRDSAGNSCFVVDALFRNPDDGSAEERTYAAIVASATLQS